jgi:hypothetical protein
VLVVDLRCVVCAVCVCGVGDLFCVYVCVLVTLAGYCVHSTVVPAIVPKTFFAPSEEIHGKELSVFIDWGCYGKRGKRGT